jgi:hypothetical protein
MLEDKASAVAKLPAITGRPASGPEIVVRPVDSYAKDLKEK